jgi:BirA family transcriptional regulator, biotin operon repressor / biotin---[acetyl-CoA-carboxylase] ligase
MEYPISFLKEQEGYEIYHAEEIDSTNSYLKRNGESFKDGSILIADNQTKGRGRYIRSWLGSKEDLMFSLLSRKPLRYEILLPVALIRVTRKHHIPSFIKWPNDIFADNRKLSGMLIESSYIGNQLDFQVIGVGMNLVEKRDVESTGISNYDKEVDKYQLLEEILFELNQLIQIPFNEVVDEYTRCDLILHRHIQYHGKRYYICGFTKEGYLIAEDEKEKIIIKSDEIDIKNSLEEKL